MNKDKQILEDIFQKYEGEESELIPVLQDIQDVFGFVPAAGMKAAAKFLSVPESNVYGVVTFYSQFYMTRQGEHKVKVCQGTACHVKGSSEIVDAISRRFNVQPGEATKDFELTLESVACFGSCALAPVMVVDGKVYGNVTPEMAITVLEALK